MDSIAAVPSPTPVRARLLAGWHEAPGLEEAWDRLLELSGGGSVFQTLRWQQAWWDAFGAGHVLLPVLAYAGARLVGIAPLMASRRRLHFIGSTNHASDYCEFIIDPEFPGAIGALLDCASAAAGPFRRIDLSHLPAHSPNCAPLLEHLAGRGVRFRNRIEQVAPARRLGNPEADRRAANKQSLRRHARHFRGAGDLRFDRPSDEAGVLRYLDAFFEQHVARWAGTGTPSQFHDPAQRAFYRGLVHRLLPRGWLRFDAMLFNGEPIAFHFGFEYRRRFVWYKPAFDVRLASRSPGEVLIKHLLEDAIDRDLEEFDFTVGAESFKFRFANVVRHVARVTAYASPADYWRDGITVAARTAWRRLRRRDPAAVPVAARGLTSAGA
ncbi:MAG: GNAT family N-acetyltransferase [Steroidobacteraceae bacterium]